MFLGSRKLQGIFNCVGFRASHPTVGKGLLD